MDHPAEILTAQVRVQPLFRGVQAVVLRPPRAIFGVQAVERACGEQTIDRDAKEGIYVGSATRLAQAEISRSHKARDVLVAHQFQLAPSELLMYSRRVSK